MKTITDEVVFTACVFYEIQRHNFPFTTSIERRTLNVEKRESTYNIPGLAIAALFVTGYLAGIACVCFLQDTWLQQWNFFGLKLLQQAEHFQIDKTALFFLCIRKRLSAFFLLWLLSFSSVRWISTGGFFLFSGLAAGTVMEALAIRYGIRGLGFYLALILPQALCYVPAFFTIGRGRRKIFLPTVVVIIGILLESYVNPAILLWALRKM